MTQLPFCWKSFPSQMTKFSTRPFLSLLSTPEFVFSFLRSPWKLGLSLSYEVSHCTFCSDFYCALYKIWTPSGWVLACFTLVLSPLAWCPSQVGA
jgi:hypothetical protein